MERYTFAVHIVAVKFTGKEICNVAPTTKQLVYCQLHYACTSICIVTCNKITIQVQVWKTLVVSAFLGVSGHWNIGEHCNIFWSVSFTLLVYFGLTFHSTNVKNFPKIFAFQSFDYAGHGPVVRRIIRLKDH